MLGSPHEHITVKLVHWLYFCSKATVQDHHGIFSSLNYDNSFDYQEFVSDFEIKIISQDERELVFDMIGVDPAIANALRRIMVAEVPTVAIERVYIRQNTSIIPDEILAHRLGLIPIDVDPREFNTIAPDVCPSLCTFCGPLPNPYLSLQWLLPDIVTTTL